MPGTIRLENSPMHRPVWAVIVWLLTDPSGATGRDQRLKSKLIPIFFRTAEN